MDTIQRVYDLAEENHISLYQLSKDSGISLATIKAAEKRCGQLKMWEQLSLKLLPHWL